MTDAADDINKRVADLTVLSFRKLEDVRRLAKHFRYVITHPLTESNPAVQKYLSSLDSTHKKIFTQKRESVEVEYIFTTAKKSNLQRQRFNSLQISEVPDLLKAELLTAEDAKQVHICTDCNVEIELNDEEPLMESLQKHFDLEIHQPKPKMKRESIDVSEPVLLPNMSRRLSSMACGETHSIDVSHLIKPSEKLDRNTYSKLNSALLKHLPDKSEATIGTAIKFYTEVVSILSQDVANIDFSAQTSSVAPIIMSIRDNVYQNFAADANKNIENDEGEQTPEKPKMQSKKFRYYGPIENLILKLLTDHKLLTLVDDRTGKLAFFCIACEYYTLRFHYDSVLNHVFSDTHIHNLSCILQSDPHVPFVLHKDPSIETIMKVNEHFLQKHEVVTHHTGWECKLCNTSAESVEQTILHILEENHLARLSDELFMKARRNDNGIPENWGPKDLSWSKFLASSSKPQNRNDHIITENFIKHSGKVGNYCTCCDMTLKGPRQVLFNHIRQKKHLRNAAPRKLCMLYKNHCRPAEYFASFGNLYVCAVCPNYVALPSYAAIVDHFESDAHFESISKLIRSALYPEADYRCDELLTMNRIVVGNSIKCEFCDETFPDVKLCVKHVLSSFEHQTAVAEAKVQDNKGDIISVYMKGNYILHSEGASFTCIACKCVFNSIRSLLTHLVFAQHFIVKPNTESVFRFYLELKHNITMLARNKYVYYEFGRLKCGVCEADVEEGENAKRHVVSSRHRESMGATYVHVNLDASGIE